MRFQELYRFQPRLFLLNVCPKFMYAGKRCYDNITIVKLYAYDIFDL